MRTIGPPLSDAERAGMIAAARAYLGTRFRHQGRSARSLDCAGLVLRAMRAIGRPVEDIRAYGHHPHQDGLQAAVERNLGPPVEGPVQSGDVLLLRQKGDPRHVALAFEQGGALYLIHTSGDFRRVIEHRLADSGWEANIVAIYRP